MSLFSSPGAFRARVPKTREACYVRQMSWSEFLSIPEKLDAMLKLLHKLQKEGDHVSQELDTLETQVRSNTDLVKSAVTLINGIAQQLADCKQEPQRIQALSDELKKDASDLAAAIAANTPAEPPTP